MKKARKGFTLVELLIVVAILAVLTTTMMVSMRGATAKAKAASIAANLESCRTAAMLYYAASGDKNLSDVAAGDMLKASLKTWDKMKKADNDDSAITYSAAGKGVDNWVVNVDFSNDTEKKEIARALHNMKGYSEVSLIAFAGDDDLGFDFFGATPAYAEGEEAEGSGGSEGGGSTGGTEGAASSGTSGNDGKLYMILITGEIKAGESTGDTLQTTSTTTETPAGTESGTGTGTGGN